MIALMRYEDLCFMGQTAKGRRMNDSVAITLEFGAGGGWSFRKQPPAGSPGVRSKGGPQGPFGQRA